MSFLVARVAFKWTSRDRSVTKGFRRGELIDLPLSATQRTELLSGGLCLEARDEQQTEALQRQLANLLYPPDGFEEMDLMLIDTPSVPAAPRDPDAVLVPPAIPPLTGQYSKFGALWRLTEQKKKAT